MTEKTDELLEAMQPFTCPRCKVVSAGFRTHPGGNIVVFCNTCGERTQPFLTRMGAWRAWELGQTHTPPMPVDPQTARAQAFEQMVTDEFSKEIDCHDLPSGMRLAYWASSAGMDEHVAGIRMQAAKDVLLGSEPNIDLLRNRLGALEFYISAIRQQFRLGRNETLWAEMERRERAARAES